jgi:hypothetical protein
MKKKLGYALGFDLSLSAPAAVALPLDWKPGDWKRVKTWLLKPKGPKSDDTRGQYERYGIISDWAWALTGELGAPGLYGIEQYAFSRNNAQASKLMELGGIVRLRLFQARDMIAQVVSTSPARKLFLGDVPQSNPKVAVQLALFNRCGAPKTWDENQCDAFIVANFMLSGFGKPVLTIATKEQAAEFWKRRRR